MISGQAKSRRTYEFSSCSAIWIRNQNSEVFEYGVAHCKFCLQVKVFDYLNHDLRVSSIILLSSVTNSFIPVRIGSMIRDLTQEGSGLFSAIQTSVWYLPSPVAYTH